MQEAGRAGGGYEDEKAGYNALSWSSATVSTTTSSSTPRTPMTTATTPTQRSTSSPGVTPPLVREYGVGEERAPNMENVMTPAMMPDPLRVAVRARRMANRIKTLESMLCHVETKSCLAVNEVQRHRERAADKEAVIRCASNAVYRGALAAAEDELAQATEHTAFMARLVHESREDVETIMEDTEKVCMELTSHVAELESLRAEKARLDDVLATLQVQAQDCERREFAALEKVSVMEGELESHNEKIRALEEALRALKSQAAAAAPAAASSEKQSQLDQHENDAERVRDKEQLQRLQEALARERATVRSLIESRRTSSYHLTSTTTTKTSSSANNTAAIFMASSTTHSQSSRHAMNAARLLVHVSASGVGVAVAFAAWWFGLVNIDTIDTAMLAMTGAGTAAEIPWT